LTYPLEANAAGFGVFKNFLKGMGKMFKKGADEMPDIGKTIEDFKGRNTNIGSKIEETINTPSKIDTGESITKFEEKMISDIENLNKEELFETHKIKKNKIRGRETDQILDLIDGLDLSEIAIETIAIFPFIKETWEGKVFKSSKYFNNPEIKERIVISCKTNFSNYYFTVLFYDDNWLLLSGIVHENKNYLDSLSTENQELLVLEDLNKYIFFSNKPKGIKKYPSNFFIISDDAKFIYIKNFDGKKNPDYFKKNIEGKIYKSSYDCKRIL
jgi:hypothetical protein